jgi:hypothetical protein
MPGKQPIQEFGKRRPAPQPEPSPPPKRSSHVALLVMGTLAVGGSAYSLMVPENCQPAAPSGVTIPAQPQAATTACTSRGSPFTGSHGNYSRTMHLSFFGGGGESSSHSSSSGSSESGSVSRGGFGGSAHAFGFSSGS